MAQGKSINKRGKGSFCSWCSSERHRVAGKGPRVVLMHNWVAFLAQRSFFFLRLKVPGCNLHGKGAGKVGIPPWLCLARKPCASSPSFFPPFLPSHRKFYALRGRCPFSRCVVLVAALRPAVCLPGRPAASITSANGYRCRERGRCL